jgi:hypothetical protein
LGLGSVHNIDDRREIALWWIGAVETLTSHWNNDLDGWYGWDEASCIRVLRMAHRKGVPLPRIEDLTVELEYDEPQPDVPRDTCLRWLIEFVRKESGDTSPLPPPPQWLREGWSRRDFNERVMLADNARAHEVVARRRKQEGRAAHVRRLKRLSRAGPDRVAGCAYRANRPGLCCARSAHEARASHH